MVKEFLKNKKNLIVSKLKKSDIDRINSIIKTINKEIEKKDFEKVKHTYHGIQDIYQKLPKEQKPLVFAKCHEIHTIISNKQVKKIDFIDAKSKVSVDDIKSQIDSAIKGDKKPVSDAVDIKSQIDLAIKGDKTPASDTVDIKSQIDLAIKGDKTPASDTVDIKSQIDLAIKGDKKPVSDAVDIKSQIDLAIKDPLKVNKDDLNQHVRLKTNVPGFDELIEKGIPIGSNILVTGSAGSGKTTFSTQVLMNNAVKGKKCLFMSFEESTDRLKGHLKQYGFDPDLLEKQGNLMLKRYDPFMISRSIEALLAEARGELVIEIDKTKGLIPDDFKPEIIVIDSLSAISAAFAEKEAAYRIYIEQLFRSFENKGLTSFLISECPEGGAALSKTGVEEFLADGVIAFYNLKKGNSRIPAIEVIKMRGTKHKKKMVPFGFIDGKGIEVYPLQEIFMD
jgi:KaiC/GvpD/RAD55 family RecA-like ATPase